MVMKVIIESNYRNTVTVDRYDRFNDKVHENARKKKKSEKK